MALESEDEFLKFPAKETRIYFLIGYILRILPYTNIVGFLFTSIGWFKLGTRTGNRRYDIAFIASLILLAITIYSTIITAPSLIESITTPGPSETTTFVDAKRKLLEAAETARSEMVDPAKYGVNIVMGIALIIEAIGVKQLVRDTRKYIGGYMVVLFIILGILYVIEALLHPVLAPELDNVIYMIDNAESMRDLYNAMFSLITVLMPILVVGVIIFVIGLITYILLAIKYWKLYDHIKRIKTLTSAEVEEKTGEIELI